MAASKRPMTLFDVARQDAKLALRQLMDYNYAERRYINPKPGAFLWQSRYGVDGKRYGSYQWVSLRELAGRTYVVEIVDYSLGILWLDEMHDPRRLYPTGRGRIDLDRACDIIEQRGAAAKFFAYSTRT